MSKRVSVNGSMDYNQFMQGYSEKMANRGVYCSVCGHDMNQPSLNSAMNPSDRRMENQYGKHMSCAQKQHSERLRGY